MLRRPHPSWADRPEQRWEPQADADPSRKKPCLPCQVRVVVRFRDDLDVPCDGDGIQADSWLRENRVSPWRNAVGPSARRLRRLHGDITPARLDAINERFSSVSKRPIPRLRRWFELDADDPKAAASIAAALRQTPDLVAQAYVSRICPPPMPPDGSLSAGTQAYLSAAPVGIGADSVLADNFPGANGAGQRAIVIESGWFLNHPDLGMHGDVPLVGKQLDEHREHGTAVLGILRGRGLSCRGIATEARVRVASSIRIPGGVKAVERMEETILQMIERCVPGDVLVIERQTTVDFGPVEGVYAPFEAEEAVFDAIRAATDAGIIVVEAGGNGAMNPNGVGANDGSAIDLDEPLGPAGSPVLDHDNRDSGAILVSAAASAEEDTSSRRHIGYAPFGSRIDAFAWGDGIGTCRGHDNTGSSYYPSSPQGFKGTSGATAIVAGAALAVQGMVQAHHGKRLDPAQMRSLLSNPELNTVHSQDGARFPIGTMPNLAAIAEMVPALAPNL